MRRSLVVIALVLLAAIAATRLSIGYLPSSRLPELIVTLDLPTDTEPSEVTRRWLVPIESAVRALGPIEGMRGEVSSSGAWLRVRLGADADPERKCARLLTSLGSLRAQLPDGARIRAWPAGSGRSPTALVAVIGDPDPTACEMVEASLRALDGVRDVSAHGCPAVETRVRLVNSRPASGDDVERAIRASRQRQSLGRWKDLRPVVVTAPTTALARLAVTAGDAVFPLARLADITTHLVAPTRRAAIRGRPAILVEVFAENGAALLPLDRRLRSVRHPGVDLEVVWSEAEPARRMFRSLGRGLASALLVTFLILLATVGPRDAARLLCASAAAIAGGVNVLWLGHVALDVWTTTALAVAIVAVSTLTLLRVTSRAASDRVDVAWFILSAALLPVAVVLAAGHLAATMTPPAIACLLAVAGASVAVLVIPAGPPDGALSPPRWLRTPLRQPAVTLLIAGVLVYVSYSLFGSALDPLADRVEADPGRIDLRLALPEGSSLEQTEARLASVEHELAEVAGIEDHWSLAQAGRATIHLQLDPDHRSRAARAEIETMLRYRLTSLDVQLDAERRTSSLSFTQDLDDQPEADSDGHLYRLLLRGTDVEQLVRASENLLGVFRGAAEWGTPSRRVYLTPVRGLTHTTGEELASELQRLTRPATPITGIGDDRIIVLERDQPTSEADTPYAPALLRRVDPGHELTASERLVRPAISRQSGRFVLPIRLTVPGRIVEDRLDYRRLIDRDVAALALAPGIDVERPSLARWRWSRERVRLLALMALMVLLLLAAASIRLDSVVAAGGALLPLAVGVAAAAPAVYGGRQLDPATLLALAGALVATLPASLRYLARVRWRAPRTSPAMAVHRSACETSPALLVSCVAVATFAVVATWGNDLHVDAWVGPLRVAAAAAVGSLLATVLVLPSATYVVLERATRTAEERRRRRQPVAWVERTERARLAVEGLGKRFAGDIWALRDVSFELTPGIIGLLGPNGAGKTTLMRCLTGLLEPTRGRVRYRGVDLEPANRSAFRRHLGVLPQEFNAYPSFTAQEFLLYWAHELGLRGRTKIADEVAQLLETVGLSDAANRKVRDFSGGMRQRIGIARALLGAPELLIVDEPTTGLDVASRNRFREILLRIAADRIVMLSTHIASDVEATASRILLLDQGGLRFDGRPSELIARARGRVFEAVVDDQEMRAYTRVHRVTRRVRRADGIQLRAVVAAGTELPGKEVAPTLEEAYLAETARGAAARSDRLSFLR